MRDILIESETIEKAGLTGPAFSMPAVGCVFCFCTYFSGQLSGSRIR